MRSTLALAMLVLSTSLAGAQDPLTEQLKKAVVDEEVNQNLDKAIQAYQAILTRFEEERQTAATALFRLAACYRKQGRKEQAIAAYRRVVDEFRDQNKLVEASRKLLSTTYGLSVHSTQVVSVTGDAQQADARRRYRASLVEEIDLLRDQIQQAQKRVEVGNAAPNGPEIVGLKRDILAVERALAAFDAGVAPIPATAIRK